MKYEDQRIVKEVKRCEMTYREVRICHVTKLSEVGCPLYGKTEAYAELRDQSGAFVIPRNSISRGFIDPIAQGVILDEKNCLVPIWNGEEERWLINDTRIHYQYQDGTWNQKYIFDLGVEPLEDHRLQAHHLVPMTDGTIYNYQKGIKIESKFDEILYQRRGIEKVVSAWKIEDASGELLTLINDRMVREDALIGHQIVSKTSLDGTVFQYDLIAFLNFDGTICSPIYYMDGVTPQEYPLEPVSPTSSFVSNPVLFYQELPHIADVVHYETPSLEKLIGLLNEKLEKQVQVHDQDMILKRSKTEAMKRYFK